MVKRANESSSSQPAKKAVPRIPALISPITQEYIDLVADPFSDSHSPPMPVPPNVASQQAICSLRGTITLGNAKTGTYIAVQPLAGPFLAADASNESPVVVGVESSGSTVNGGTDSIFQGTAGTHYTYFDWGAAPYSTATDFGNNYDDKKYRVKVVGLRWRYIGRDDELAGRTVAAISENHGPFVATTTAANIEAQPHSLNLAASKKWQTLIWTPFDTSHSTTVANYDDKLRMETLYRSEPLWGASMAAFFVGFTTGTSIEYEVISHYEIIGGTKSRGFANYGASYAGVSHHPEGRQAYQQGVASDDLGGVAAIQAGNHVEGVQGAERRKRMMQTDVTQSLLNTSGVFSLLHVINQMPVAQRRALIQGAYSAGVHGAAFIRSAAAAYMGG